MLCINNIPTSHRQQISDHFRHIQYVFPNRREQIASSQVSIQVLLRRRFQPRLGNPSCRENRISVQNGQHFNRLIDSIVSHQNCRDRSVHRTTAHLKTQLCFNDSVQIKNNLRNRVITQQFDIILLRELLVKPDPVIHFNHAFVRGRVLDVPFKSIWLLT